MKRTLKIRRPPVRAINLQIRLSESQMERLAKRAASHHLRLSTWARMILLKEVE